MDDESELEESRPAPKKSSEPKPIRPWTALMLWLMLNLIWIAAVPMGSPHPVMEPDSGYREWHDMEVPNVIGRDLPLHIECSFEPESSLHKTIDVLWSLKGGTDEEPIEVRTWEGKLGDDCPVSDHNVSSGVYILHVELFFENGTKVDPSHVSEVSNINFEMEYWIYHPVRREGLIAANLLGFAVLVLDQSIRHLRRRKRMLKLANLPLHKLRQKEEWESLVESMEGGDEADVGKFVMPSDRTAEAERERLRKQFEAQESQTEEAEPDAVEIPEEAEKELIGEFDGTERGLEGDLDADEGIHTVKDIWRRIEEDEEI